MMNAYHRPGQSYGFPGRNNRHTHDYESVPYRRPSGRGGMYDRGAYPYGQSGHGCGCSLGNQTVLNNRQMRNNSTPPYNQSCKQRPTPCQNPSAVPVGTYAGTDCGCSHDRDKAARKKLMEQIRAIDFALYETILYLDVYPHSCDALETYHKLKAQKEALHKEYQATYGPITAFGNESATSWDWIEKPFPWEYASNAD